MTRTVVIGLIKDNQIPLIEQPFYPDELYSADECLVTSTLYEVMPVTSLNGKNVGNGRSGEVSQRLLNLFQRLIA